MYSFSSFRCEFHATHLCQSIQTLFRLGIHSISCFHHTGASSLRSCHVQYRYLHIQLLKQCCIQDFQASKLLWVMDQMIQKMKFGVYSPVSQFPFNVAFRGCLNAFSCHSWSPIRTLSNIVSLLYIINELNGSEHTAFNISIGFCSISPVPQLREPAKKERVMSNLQ